MNFIITDNHFVLDSYYLIGWKEKIGIEIQERFSKRDKEKIVKQILNYDETFNITFFGCSPILKQIEKEIKKEKPEVKTTWQFY